MSDDSSPFRFSVLIVILSALITVSSHAADITVTLPDAVLRTFGDSPGVKIEKLKVEESEALVQKAAGRFDWTIVSKDRWVKESVRLSSGEKAFLVPILGPSKVPDIHKLEVAEYELGISKQFRSGITVMPDIIGFDTRDNLLGGPPANRPNLGVRVDIPLLRGLGPSVAGADELAASSNRTAAEALYIQNVSSRIYQTVKAYWDCLAALKNYELAREVKTRADEIAVTIERLVRGGEFRPGVLHQVEGSLRQRGVDLVNAERLLYEMRQVLGFSMGVPPGAVEEIPLPEGSFPDVVSEYRSQAGQQQAKLVDEAMKTRGDLLAARQNVHTEETLLKKAKNGLLPRVDFQSRITVANLKDSNSADRFVTSYGGEYTGPNFYTQLNVEIPLENNFAIGELRRRQSMTERAKLQSIEVVNKVAKDVAIALNAVSSSISEYEQAVRFAENYGRAVDHQFRLVKAMESNITDLITMEDRYFQGRLAQIAALHNYAVSMVELRYVTGTLVKKVNNELQCDTAALSKPPFIY